MIFHNESCRDLHSLRLFQLSLILKDQLLIQKSGHGTKTSLTTALYLAHGLHTEALHMGQRQGCLLSESEFPSLKRTLLAL